MMMMLNNAGVLNGVKKNRAANDFHAFEWPALLQSWVLVCIV